MLIVIEDGKMVFPGIPRLTVQYFITVLGRCDNHPTRNGEEPLTPDSLVPIFLRSSRDKGPGGRLCRFHNVPQDGISAEMAEVANCRLQPAPNAGLCHPPPHC